MEPTLVERQRGLLRPATPARADALAEAHGALLMRDKNTRDGPELVEAVALELSHPSATRDAHHRAGMP